MGETYTGCSVLGESENVYCKVNITTCVGSLGGLIPLSAYGEDGYGDVCDHRCGFKGEYDYSYGYDYSSPPLTTSGDNLVDTMLAGLFANYYPQYAGLFGYSPTGYSPLFSSPGFGN
eukprot:TRINITY_DN2397_c0_g1_i5.p4 TRINITY_DN2397_c0_g1~~TRINITY_DN2397_c0_g1_i5.p4  ORF type:complete len:117 (+),score=8.84 TRINITY_DN2397_c0_g1_i5:3-353(+)